MKILCLAGSLREGSYNKKLVRIAHEILISSNKAESNYIDLADFPLPVYNQDMEAKEYPPTAKQLVEKIVAVDGLVISTPENNGSIAATLKNMVDWVSRSPQNPWPHKWVLLLGTSPGALGAVRGLWHSRIPFEALNCHVYPEMMGLPKAHEAFDAQGALKDSTTRTRLEKLLYAYIERVN